MIRKWMIKVGKKKDYMASNSFIYVSKRSELW